jgi:DNase/tRNase domain of colicin-like bacteriocin
MCKDKCLRERQVRVNADGKVIIQHGKDESKAQKVILSGEAGQTLTKDGFTRARDENGFVIFESKFDTFVPDHMLGTQKEGQHFKHSNEHVKEMLQQNPNLASEMGLSQEQINFFTKKRMSSKAPEGLTWHHHPDTGRMQLVDRAEHEAFVPHTGGMSIWGGGYARS